MQHLLEVGKSTTLNVKLYQFFFQYKNATEIFIINTPGIMKKSKYQQYLYCFIVCMLVPYAFWFSYLRSATFRGAVHIRGGGGGPLSVWIPKGTALIWGLPLIRQNSVFQKLYFSSHIRVFFSKAFIGFIDFMLNGKSLLKYRNLFFLKEYKTNDNMIFKYFP